MTKGRPARESQALPVVRLSDNMGRSASALHDMISKRSIHAERVVFPNLRPTTRSISLRLPLRMLERIKAEANSRDVPYQSLIKIWLEEKLSA
jgi:predicted DNA binding CopG/RHH family protein